MSGEARELFAAFVPDGDLGKFAARLATSPPPGLHRDDEAPAERGLPGPSGELPARRRSFIVAYEAEDTVTSEWLVRDVDGKEYKPEDYLTAFARFVRENPDQIEAIRILLDRPQDWSTDALAELRQKLAAAPERFTVENLQKAHEVQYKKALVDIISMVKHAADERLAALHRRGARRPRVRRITEGKTFTPEQQQWLDRIRAHLVQNLRSIGTTSKPCRSSPAGGWGRVTNVFRGETAWNFSRQLNRGHRRMTDIVQKLWGFCHTLRHDGIDYGDYIEQITYLLFLKMADERGIELSRIELKHGQARAGGRLLLAGSRSRAAPS